VGRARKKKRGSAGGVVALWILGLIFTIIGLFLVVTLFVGIPLLIIAFIYSIWRGATKYGVCPKCKSENVKELTVRVYKKWKRTGELPLPVNMEKCPHCAETIQADANVCKHCGRDIEPTTSTEEKEKAVED
jgi:RNA polymerase subunit RPABC4/transcription elongation factor Spt4